MIRILLINLDSNDYAGYSSLVACSLFNLNKETKLSLICTEGKEVYESLGVFERVYQIDQEDVLGANSLQIISEKLPELFSSEWSYVINNSRDTDSAGLASSIKAKEKVGPTRDRTKEIGISHNSFFSFLLTEKSSGHFPLHISQIYFEIVSYHNEIKSVPTVWSSKHIDDLKFKLKRVLEKRSKKHFVLVDTELGRVNNVGNINFFLNFVKTIDESPEFSPLLFTKNIDNDSFIIDKLRSSLGDELHVVAVEDKSLLQLLSNVELVVTDSYAVKTFADLVSTPTLFINSMNELPLSNYSINERSVLINSVVKNSKFVEECLKACRLILSKQTDQLADLPVNSFRTIVQDGKSLLSPLGPISSTHELEYYRWMLSVKYLSFLEKLEMPEVKINSKKYSEIINSERTSIKEVFNLLLDKVKDKESYDSLDPFLKGKLEKSSDVLLLALSYSQFNNNSSPHSLKKFLTDAKPVIKDLMVFLANEETIYQNKDT
ncbi:MAG: hypothetical protein K2P81_06110 [Bacteriovoracaceae bacterium]|nr:hypothetical protein [Bacteriovoracaceae bacterium]